MHPQVLQPAVDAVGKIARGELSARTLLECYLERIGRFDPALNALVTVDAEGARRRADEADRAVRERRKLGPLHGLPMTIKDTLETAGMRTTAGSPDLAGHVPEHDATAVERLVAAGAIVFGKTNTPMLAGDVQSYNSLFPTTNNPWNVARTCGGSSGGAAVAVAAGLTGLEYGSDIGGSIRTPAAWCGVYGHKPTYGIVPVRGHIPGPPGTLSEADLGVVGPIARSAADLALALTVTAGPSCDRATAWTLDFPAARHQRLSDYRVAAWLDDPDFPVDSEVQAHLQAVVERLRGQGVKVADGARPGFGLAELFETYLALLWPILISGYPDEVFEGLSAMARASGGERSHSARMAAYGTQTHRRWLSANERREEMRASAARFFADFDVLLMPVTPVVAIPHDHSEPLTERSITVNGRPRSYVDLLAWISPATALLHPATSAPVGPSASGLPVGLQIVGPYLEDLTTIDFATRLGQAIGGYVPPPGY